MVHQQNATFHLQENDSLNASTSTRSTYDEPLQSVPEGLNPRQCKQTKLREPPPVPYIPKKNKVQEEVVKLCQLQIKTSLEKDTTLKFPLWQENGTREAFLMHVTAVLDVIK
jgi:hypothetical protein